MTCELCRFEIGRPGRLTALEFRDDGVPFLAVRMDCPECRWRNIVEEYYGPTVWGVNLVLRAHRDGPISPNEGGGSVGA